METREIPGEDADAALTAAVEDCLKRHVEKLQLLHDVHHVRLRTAGAGSTAFSTAAPTDSRRSKRSTPRSTR